MANPLNANGVAQIKWKPIRSNKCPDPKEKWNHKNDALRSSKLAPYQLRNNDKLHKATMKTIGYPKHEKSNLFSNWLEKVKSHEENPVQRCQVTWDVNKDLAMEIMVDVGVSTLVEDIYDDNQLPNNLIHRLGEECESFEPEINTNLPSTSNVRYSMTYHGLGEDLVLHRRRRGTNPRGINHTANISDEVILQIFSFLPMKDLTSSAQVCRRWKSVAYDESLWRKIDLKKKYLHAGTLGYVIDRKVKMLRLAFAKVESPIFSPNIVTEDFLCKIEYLDLSLCSITEQGLEEILQISFLLKKLSLENMQLNDTICRCIGQNPNLEVLNLSMCSGLTAHGVLLIISKCKKLRSLNMSWTGICSYSFDLLAIHLTPAIQYLNISGARNTLRDAHITMLSDLCPNLKELDISDGLKLTSAVIEVIASKLILLEHLHASHGYNIAPVKYLELRQLPYLKELEVFGLFTEEALQALRQSLPTTEINKQIFSTIARPSPGIKDWKMWGIQFRRRF